MHVQGDDVIGRREGVALPARVPPAAAVRMAGSNSRTKNGVSNVSVRPTFVSRLTARWGGCFPL
jgi:hypothetical protein